MRPISVLSLAVALVLLRGSATCDGATPPDPMDPAALDVVLSDTTRMTHAQVDALHRETTRVWSRAGLTLEWPDRPRPPHSYVVVRIDWTMREVVDGNRSWPLGWMFFVDGRPSGRTITVSAASVAELVSQVAINGRPLTELPRTLRDGLLARMLARALAHEIGHYLLGPTHTASGLMRARFPLAQLIEPSATRYTLSAQQQALARSATRDAIVGKVAYGEAGTALDRLPW